MTQDKQEDASLPSIHSGEVKGLDCPVCGHPTLMIFDGYITCTLANCPNPDYADAIQRYTEQRVKEATEPLNRILEMSGTSRCEECHEYMHDDDLTYCEYCDKIFHDWCAGYTYDGDGEHPSESAYALCTEHAQRQSLEDKNVQTSQQKWAG